MMTVREFALGAVRPEAICVLIGNEEYELVSEETEKLNGRLLDMLGDYLVEDYKASKPNRYDVWVLMRPVKRGEDIA